MVLQSGTDGAPEFPGGVLPLLARTPFWLYKNNHLREKNIILPDKIFAVGFPLPGFVTKR